jgi:hypothetical protein
MRAMEEDKERASIYFKPKLRSVWWLLIKELKQCVI